MRLTAKGRYAVTAMLDLAVHQGSGPISLADISERQGISLSYLEQLFSKMRRNDLVCSVRGPGGGYKLSRDSADICVAEIVDSVDETLDATRCAGKADCHQGQRCLTHDLWAGLSIQIHQFLSEIDLASIIARGEVHQLLPAKGAVQEESAQFEVLERLSSREL
jgi:Rrf2 family iron-sulfur cluster assembly transcriptional regulator